MENKHPDPLFDISGKTAVITGGGGVLGGAIALGLAELGVNVAILDRTRQSGDQVVEKIISAGGKALAVECDALNKSNLVEAHRIVRDHFGRTDFLINGVGGNKAEATTSSEQSFFDLPEDALQWVFNLNFLSAVLACQVFGREMAENQAGVILNFSSMNAFRPLTRIPAYSAAKSAINNFTQWLAVHMAQEYYPAIRVNALAPGFFMTEQNRFLLTDRATGELSARGQKIIDHTPIGCFGTPQDLIGTAVWLLSPASAFVTGVVVPIDGGFSVFSGV